MTSDGRIVKPPPEIGRKLTGRAERADQHIRFIPIDPPRFPFFSRTEGGAVCLPDGGQDAGAQKSGK